MFFRIVYDRLEEISARYVALLSSGPRWLLLLDEIRSFGELLCVEVSAAALRRDPSLISNQGIKAQSVDLHPVFILITNDVMRSY